MTKQEAIRIAVLDDVRMMLAKAENARARAIKARDEANLAIEYADDCAMLAVRVLRTLSHESPQAPADGEEAR